MNAKTILSAAVLAALCGAAAAEDAPQQQRVAIAVENGAPGFAIHAGHIEKQQKIVKNAPYSAQVIVEDRETLADGNVIEKQFVTQSYRDSNGRTRQDIPGKNNEVRMVSIHDETSTTILRPAEKRATRISHDTGALGRELAAKARERVRIERRGGAEGEAESRTIVVERPASPGAHPVHIDGPVRIQVMTPPAGLDPERIGPVIASAFTNMKYAKTATVKDLGTKQIEGLRAKGELSTYEIPAGDIGNARPIVVTEETWYSPDLQITLYSKHVDPRSGEKIYRVTNLKREEPAASLFTVPSDYKLKDVEADMRRALESKK